MRLIGPVVKPFLPTRAPDPFGPGRSRCYHPPAASERSHRGLVRRFAKPLSGVTCSEGSNPSLSASRTPHAPVAQWIERQVADLKAVSSSLAGRATVLPLPPHCPYLRADLRSGPGSARALDGPSGRVP